MDNAHQYSYDKSISARISTGLLHAIFTTAPYVYTRILDSVPDAAIFAGSTTDVHWRNRLPITEDTQSDRARARAHRFVLLIVRNELRDQTEINESRIPSFRDCNSANRGRDRTEKNCVMMNIAGLRSICRTRKYVMNADTTRWTGFCLFKRKS